MAIVGEIVDYKFVPFETPIPVGTRSKKNQEKTDIKDYGNIAIFTKNSNDILEKLLTHFDSSTAYKLYVIAILRCAYPKAVNRDLKFYYETSFMSELFKKLVYLNHYYQTSLKKLVEHIQIYITSVRQNKWV
nr:hypothetical protein [Mycoplasmopsis bovis]